MRFCGISGKRSRLAAYSRRKNHLAFSHEKVYIRSPITTTPPAQHIALFHGKEIRKTIHESEWWFSVVDVVAVLTESTNSRDYWYRMKIRVQTEDGAELSTLCRPLKLQSSDGKMYETDCANTQGIFRIIQSIPSPKAEPFKLWLAKVGYERVPFGVHQADANAQ